MSINPQISTAEDCAKMHCFEQPEQSQCRGLCRRQREIHNVEQIQRGPR